MNLTTLLRPAALLAATLALASCGGKATFPIAGTINGLEYSGLVLNTNGMTVNVAASAKNFSFPNTVSYGEVYAVTANPQPQHQTCTTVDPTTGRDTGTDTAGRLASIAIVVTCTTNAYTLSGTINYVDKNNTPGTLPTADLVLTNGSAGGTVTNAIGATSFLFGSTVPYNVSYGVTVYTQPANAFCTVVNGTGVMGDANVTNIVVNCKGT